MTTRKRPPQRDRVLRLLLDHENGVCSNTFVYDEHPGIPRVAVHIHTLRGDGWRIETERCDLHPHIDPDTGRRTSRVKKYRLVTHLYGGPR